MKKRPVMLIIMDGYGLAPASDTNAVSLAKKPNLKFSKIKNNKGKETKYFDEFF